MIPINKRKIGVCILLSFVTFGIYQIYWEYLLVKNTRAIRKDESSCTREMLCLVFVPFYSLFWWFTRGKVVKEKFSEHGCSATGNEIAYLILGIFGLAIVSMAIMQNDFNALSSGSVQAVYHGTGKYSARIARFFGQEQNRTVYVLSFFLPFFIFSLALAFRNVYPFGDQQILNYDGWHQYYPFLMKLWDHFHQGQSLLYDRSMGMGTNFLSLLSYYGASPLNLILMLSPARDFRVTFTLLCAVKIGLAGLFTARLLTELFPGKSGYAPAFFGLGYALSGYLMGYYWNTMWLDSIALMPLLCWCTVRLLRKNKSALYAAVLGLVLFTNYYIGYMCCLFTVLVFLALCLIDRVGWSGFWRRLARFAVSSLLGGALAAVMLLPAFFGLLNTASVSGSFSWRLNFYESLRDLLAPLTDFQTPTVMESGLPNLYCGALIALFAFAFLWAKKVDFRAKLCGFFLTVFLLLSINTTVLNYIWHAFHVPNMIPYRFAFLFALTLVVMGYGYYRRGLKDLDAIDAVGMFLFIGLVVYCAWGLFDSVSILLTVAILAGAVSLGGLYAARMIPKKVMTVFVCLALLTETGVGAWLGTGAVGTTSYSGYFRGEDGEAISAAAAQVNEWEKDSADFCRTEGVEWYSLNDSCFFDYNGISQFASSANARVSGFLQKLGLPADARANRFVYTYSTPLVNTLLGVKYLIYYDQYGNGSLNDPELISLNTPVENDRVELYENTGFAGLGFGVEAAAADFAFDSSLPPYENQNALFRALTGLEGDLLIPLEAEADPRSDSFAVTAVGAGYWNCTKINDGNDATLRIRASNPVSGTVLVYARVPDARFVQVNNAGWHQVEQDYACFFSVGWFRAGETITLRAIVHDISQGDSVSAALQACVVDTALWQKGLERLKREPMEISSFTETSMEASVTMAEDGYLYTSIPMERKGWTLFVDGEKAEILPFADAFVGVKLSQGQHTLSFRYSPRGFIQGLVISLAALALTVSLAVAEKRGFALFREKNAPRPALSLYVDEKDRWNE